MRASNRHLQLHSAFPSILLLSLFCGSLLAPARAQTGVAPPLHRRSPSPGAGNDDADTALVSHGRTALPLEASGEYLLGGKGDAIEIDLEPHRLSGYVSRRGDRNSDQDTPLTFFFATSLLNGQEMSFTTHRVHGMWFSFRGTIVRGKARARTEDGYYRLQGTLVMYDASANTQQTREVFLPLARQYSGK